MTQQATENEGGGAREAGRVRLLKIVVVAMGLMIVAGLAAVIGRVIYLASSGQKQAIATSTRGQAQVRLALPPQAVVKLLALSGDRLAVHFEGPAGAGIAIVDVVTGAVLSRVDLVPEVPR